MKISSGKIHCYLIMSFLLAGCGGGGGSTEATVQASPAPSATQPEPAKSGAASNSGLVPNLLSTTTSRHFYVSTSGSDTNPGTKEAPFQTITKASQAAVPDSTVHVEAGTYSGGIVTNSSGSESGRIYFVSDTKWGAKIIPPASSTTSIAWLVSGNNVTINGFEIDGTAAPSAGMHWRLGILTTASNVVIENNHIHHIANSIADCLRSGGGAIVGDSQNGGKNITMDRNLVHHIGIAMACPLFHGLYMSTSGTIKNNIVHNVGYGGIHLWHDADHVDIVNNTIFKAPKGILVGSGDKYLLATPGDYINVANNILVANDYGVIEESDGSGNGSHNFYVNNLFYQNKINTAISRQNLPNVSGSIFADPLFVQYDETGKGDYQLKSNSPAIDKGSPTYKSQSDFNGVSRPRGGSDDIGAMEF